MNIKKNIFVILIFTLLCSEKIIAQVSNQNVQQNDGNISYQKKIEIFNNYLKQTKEFIKCNWSIDNIQRINFGQNAIFFLVEWKLPLDTYQTDAEQCVCFYTMNLENKIQDTTFTCSAPTDKMYNNFCIGDMTGLKYSGIRTYWYGDITQNGCDELVFIFPPTVDPFSNIQIYGYDNIKKEFVTYADINLKFTYPPVPAFEFCIYKGVRGFKVRQPRYVELPGIDAQGDQNYEWAYDWNFYTWDKTKQKYMQTAGYPSEQEMSELKDLHGSPDFFAYIGLDFPKLNEQLNASDVQNLTKAQLRIYRNAVYARHGRSFKSEDLQSLFNEYDWYKKNPDYTDNLLTDTDRGNIKIIQKAEAVAASETQAE